MFALQCGNAVRIYTNLQLYIQLRYLVRTNFMPTSRILYTHPLYSPISLYRHHCMAKAWYCSFPCDCTSNTISSRPHSEVPHQKLIALLAVKKQSFAGLQNMFCVFGVVSHRQAAMLLPILRHAITESANSTCLEQMT